MENISITRHEDKSYTVSKDGIDKWVASDVISQWCDNLTHFSKLSNKTYTHLRVKDVSKEQIIDKYSSAYIVDYKECKKNI